MQAHERFNGLLANLALTPAQQEDGVKKHTGVRSCLNSHYWGTSSGYSNSVLVGSWGKSTEIRPPRDIDVLFTLPWTVYTRFDQRPSYLNKQSELLQEVKNVLKESYPTTAMRADGQVVVVPFVSYAVEVLPAFASSTGRYWICDTNNGGKYKEVDPEAEQVQLRYANERSKGNARNLIRIMKCWQGECNVPLPSFCIELLAVEFLSTWLYADKSSVYYDWMVRDFLAFLVGKANSFVLSPGVYDVIYLGDAWKSRADMARTRAIKGCEYESEGANVDAWWEWKNIFGDSVPLGS